jgi:hypothetical protein
MQLDGQHLVPAALLAAAEHDVRGLLVTLPRWWRATTSCECGSDGDGGILPCSSQRVPPGMLVR